MSYLNCSQATLAAVAESMGLDYRETLRAACPLEGGAVSTGSTCGVVSGGCAALALAFAEGRGRGEAKDAAALYVSLRDYTSWFEREFGSTLCRERCNVDMTTAAGLANYLFTGKFASRCLAHVGPAAYRLVSQGRRLRDAPAGSGGRRACGYCARESLAGIREDTGRGSPFLEEISLALDGGVGLSGGICGALAGALLPVGSIWGIDPAAAGLSGTLAAFLKGHANMYRGLDRPELWSVGGRLVRGFRREFGSLECSAITGRRFEGEGALADYVEGSAVCAAAGEWCRREASRLITTALQTR